MEMEITLPDEVPVMTLPNTAFFPQALMPLHIFEPRYREMLRDSLATNRLFAVAGLNLRQVNDPDNFEPPHRIASVGIIRACQKNDNGRRRAGPFRVRNDHRFSPLHDRHTRVGGPKIDTKNAAHAARFSNARAPPPPSWVYRLRING